MSHGDRWSGGWARQGRCGAVFQGIIRVNLMVKFRYVIVALQVLHLKFIVIGQEKNRAIEHGFRG